MAEYGFKKSAIQERFDSGITSLKKAISGINVHASVSIFEGIKCEVYGSSYPVGNFANITATDSRTLVIQVWDEAARSPIYKSIQTSGISANPVMEGGSIRVVLPPITEDRRKEMANLIKKNSEGAKVSVRNIRRDEIENVRKALRTKEISEDQAKKYETEIQNITDKTISQIETDVQKKVDDIMKV